MAHGYGPSSQRVMDNSHDMLNRVKLTVKRVAGPRTLRVLRYLHSLLYFHPTERVVSEARIIIGLATGRLQLLAPDQAVLNRIFYVCVNAKGQERFVTKLVRGDNEYSCAFIRSLRSREFSRRYANTIGGLQSLPHIGGHCPAVFGIRSDGGYSSAFVSGFNLASLRRTMFSEQSLPAELRSCLVEALISLRRDLAAFGGGRGHVIGDWAPHNLIFSPEQASIINVDAEGFFTYRDPCLVNDLAWINAYIDEMQDYLECLLARKPEGPRIASAMRVLHKVQRREEAYDGSRYLVGYHSHELRGIKFRGQRECAERLRNVPFNFDGRTVLDLGCNSGGMLHALSGRIRRGIGFDVNPDCVNAAHAVLQLNGIGNLDFFTFDLDREPLQDIRDMCLLDRVDICLLLSVCMWLRKWKSVLRFAAESADALLFESNGSEQEQESQVEQLRYLYASVRLVEDHSPDDLLQSKRATYLCCGSRVLLA